MDCLGRQGMEPAARRNPFLKRVTLGMTELAGRRQLLYNISDLEPVKVFCIKERLDGGEWESSTRLPLDNSSIPPLVGLSFQYLLIPHTSTQLLTKKIPYIWV